MFPKKSWTWVVGRYQQHDCAGEVRIFYQSHTPVAVLERFAVDILPADKFMLLLPEWQLWLAAFWRNRSFFQALQACLVRWHRDLRTSKSFWLPPAGGWRFVRASTRLIPVLLAMPPHFTWGDFLVFESAGKYGFNSGTQYRHRTFHLFTWALLISGRVSLIGSNDFFDWL